MIEFESTDDDKLFDELAIEISDDIIKMGDIAAKYVVYASPVDTGLFKGNWNASIDQEYDGSFINEDPDGNSTLHKMESDIGSFNIAVDTKIFIQNNVKNPDDEMEPYAATVAFDETTQTAESIVSGAAITAAEGVN